jgi:outer membrane autotransporter protein
MHQDYAGVQAGFDLATLNSGGSGESFHFGVTGGYLEARTKDTTPFATFFNPSAGATLISPAGTFEVTSKVPFVGLYANVSSHGFFADTMARVDFYQNSMTDPSQPISGLNEDAIGFSLTGNVGYNIALGGGWFIEPAAGLIWSELRPDAFVLPKFSSLSVPDAVSIDKIHSALARGGISVGTNVSAAGVVWQPYVTVAVVHEIAGNVNATQSTNVTVCGPCTIQPVSLSTSIDRLGTYGQYTLGTAVVLGNTGWLGYGRVDYRNGENIEGVSGNVGLRYQW